MLSVPRITKKYQYKVIVQKRKLSNFVFLFFVVVGFVCLFLDKTTFLIATQSLHYDYFESAEVRG